LFATRDCVLPSSANFIGAPITACFKERNLMQDLANRLIAQARGTNHQVTAQATGGEPLALGTLVERARFRVGLWPLKSDASPEGAMGLLTALGFLLERYSELVVYRVFTQIDGEPDDFDWDINLSQFGVDDFEIDGLDENVAIWGSLEYEDRAWKLDLEVEIDAAGSQAENPLLNYSAADWNGLVSLLPQVAADITALLGTEAIDPVAPIYAPGASPSQAVEALLSDAFAWENELLLALWGTDWPDDALVEDETALIGLGQAVGATFGSWLVANLVARAMKTEIGRNALLPTIETVIEAFPETSLPWVILGAAAYETGGKGEDKGLELVRDAVGHHHEDVLPRQAMAEIFLRMNRLNDMVDVFQRSVHDEVTNVPLYLRYGEILTALRLNGLVTPRYVFTGGDRDVVQMLNEAVASYDKVLEIEPNNVEAIYRRALLLAEADDERLWATFQQLVDLDITGERTRAVIDSFQMVENIAPGIRILKAAIQKNPNSVFAHVNLAAALLSAERGSEARAELEQAEALTDSRATLADIERLLLSAADPDFEFRLGTISDIVNAGRPLDDADIEYLEDALEDAQSFSLGYQLLAKAYIAENDTPAALETLLDGQKILPEDSDITALLAQTLWDADESDLAFQYLNQGLEINPDAVPLLVLTGRFLYEDEQVEEARDFLSRASSLDPNNTTLKDVKLHISRTMDLDD
jgi:tetratricopeptide (TPR) repeat protein